MRKHYLGLSGLILAAVLLTAWGLMARAQGGGQPAPPTPPPPPAAAQAQAPAAAEPPMPHTVKVVVKILDGGTTYTMLAYASDQFVLNSPLNPKDPDAGMFNLGGMVKVLRQGDRALFQYKLAVSLPSVRPSGQRTVQFSSDGEASIYYGKEKDLARFGESVVRITMTPEDQ